MTKLIIPIIIILFLANNFESRLKRFKKRIIDYTKIQSCNDLDDRRLQNYQNTFDSVTDDECKHKSIYAYTIDLYVPINCYLRTNLFDAKSLTRYPFLETAISEITAILKKTSDSDDIIKKIGTNIVVFRGSTLSETPTVGSNWKNFSFLSTSLIENFSGFVDTSRINAWILKFKPDTGKALTGRVLNSCSATPNEKEFLMERDLCWKITNVNESDKIVTFINQVCSAATIYKDL